MQYKGVFMRKLFSLSIGCLSFLASLVSTTDAMAAAQSRSFGDFYTESAAEIYPNSIIPLSVTLASSSDVQFSGDGIITLNTPGYYFVNFGVSQTEGSAVQAQLCANGVPISGATVLPSNPPPGGLLSTSTIIQITEAGTQLTLQNTNPSTTIHLGTGFASCPTPTSTPTAFLSLNRIGN
jgi:hypothetical protein